MQDILVGTSLGLLIVMQWFIIWECIKMKTTVGEHSTDLKTEMGNLGLLLDEAVDFLADTSRPGPVAQAAGGTIQEIILSGLMNKMMMPPNYGSTQEPQERPIQQDDAADAGSSFNVMKAAETALVANALFRTIRN